MAKVNNDSWLIDSATSSHITNRRENLTGFSPLQKIVKGVEGTDVPVLGKGTVALSSRVNGRTQTLILKDVLYMPQAPNSLFSVTRLDKTGGHAKMGGGTTELYDKQKNCWSNTCIAQGNACIQLTCCSVVVLVVAN